MSRSALCFMLFLVGGGALAVDQPTQSVSSSGQSSESNPLPAGGGAPHALAFSGRKTLEAKLNSPARLDFGGRQRVAAQEVLDQLRERHQLSIRFDMPTFAWLMGEEPPSPLKQSPLMQSAQVTRFGSPGQGSRIYSASPVPTHAEFVGVPTIEAEAVLQNAVNGNVAYGPAPATASPAPPPIDAAPGGAPASSVPTGLPNGNSGLGPAAAPSELPSTDNLPTPTNSPAYKAAPEQAGSKPNDKEAREKPLLSESLQELFKVEIDVLAIDLKNVSVATALRHALDAAPIVSEDMSGIPIPTTDALLLDYLIEEDGLLITTRMKALVSKETRVYSIKHLRDCPAEQLSKLIRQSIRPWSWRSQINDLGDQLKGTPLPAEFLTSMIKSSVQLAAAEMGATVSMPADNESSNSVHAASVSATKSDPSSEAQQMAIVGNALVNGLVTFAHTTLSTLEMIHYGEPPTGTIQTLPGKLIITQSQLAHREIADLLKQLAED